MNSNKDQNFRRVAERRTNATLNSLRLLGQCSNRRIYEYTEEEVKHLFREIESELKRVRGLFNPNHSTKSFKFE